MSIKTWVQDEKTFYTIRMMLRGRNRALRISKQESGVIEDKNPDLIKKKLARIEERLKDESKRELIQMESAGLTWGQLVEQWKEALQQESSENGKEGINQPVRRSTASGYIQAIDDFTSGWNRLYAKDISPADVDDVFKRMRKIGYSNCRMYNVKVAISRCYKWGMMRRLIPGASMSPTHGFGISRKESKRPEILNASQIEFLLTEAHRLNHPWRYIWNGAYHTGARSGELNQLKAKHVDLVEKKITLEEQWSFASRSVEPLKDGEWRQVPINSDLYQLIIELGVLTKGPEEFIFPRITAWKNGEAAKVLRAFCEEIKIPSICFHTLRACWATQLLKNKISEPVVMKLGGWSDPETMHRYIRLAGIEIDGATDSLSFKTKRERPGRILRVVGEVAE